MLANNETGVIMPVPEISRRIKALNQSRAASGLPQVLVHTDAAQALGKRRVDVEDLAVDFLTIVGHKTANQSVRGGGPVRLPDWPEHGAQPMRIPGDPRLRPQTLRLGGDSTLQRSGDGRGAEKRAGPRGEPTRQSAAAHTLTPFLHRRFCFFQEGLYGLQRHHTSGACSHPGCDRGHEGSLGQPQQLLCGRHLRGADFYPQAKLRSTKPSAATRTLRQRRGAGPMPTRDGGNGARRGEGHTRGNWPRHRVGGRSGAGGTGRPSSPLPAAVAGRLRLPPPSGGSGLPAVASVSRRARVPHRDLAAGGTGSASARPSEPQGLAARPALPVSRPPHGPPPGARREAPRPPLSPRGRLT
ncbi:hypothetical protein NN561_012008 [Cricetulus griseus]